MSYFGAQCGLRVEAFTHSGLFFNEGNGFSWPLHQTEFAVSPKLEVVSDVSDQGES